MVIIRKIQQIKKEIITYDHQVNLNFKRTKTKKYNKCQ
jgi:hypothetical protein